MRRRLTPAAISKEAFFTIFPAGSMSSASAFPIRAAPISNTRLLLKGLRTETNENISVSADNTDCQEFKN